MTIRPTIPTISRRGLSREEAASEQNEFLEMQR